MLTDPRVTHSSRINHDQESSNNPFMSYKSVKLTAASNTGNVTRQQSAPEASGFFRPAAAAALS